jgi:hypothetical protein
MGQGRGIGRFLGDTHGGVVQLLALAIPAVLMLSVGAVDLASVSSDRLLVQDTADSAALAAAKELGLSDPNSVAERAQAFSHTKLSGLSDRLTYNVSVEPAEDGGSVTVSITGVRKSFFGNMLPPGGWKIAQSATASIMGRIPLCVLSTGKVKAYDINMDDSARITAPGCLVHGNANLEIKKSASLSAHTVQVAGEASGSVYPQAQEGAPEIGDPFADVTFTAPKSQPCKLLAPLLGNGLLPIKLQPGRHCFDIKVMQHQTLELEPGVYWFTDGAKLELLEDSVLKGSNVLLVFDKGSDFKFKDRASIELRGRESGVYSGFVLATTRGNIGVFEISSSAARELLGTIYIPEATLWVDGKHKIADQSAWTVVVAKAVKMKGSPSLVINSNYAGTSVKPPDGVGPNATDVRLTQ